MTALSDFSFLKTGTLSSPPDDEHSGAVAAAWGGSSLLGVHPPREAREFPDPLERGRGQKDKLLRLQQHVWITLVPADPTGDAATLLGLPVAVFLSLAWWRAE